jgi:GNAT superfamily N-acetyltransferase
MSLTVERFDARPWADGDLEPLFEGAFPAFITADQAAKAYIGRVREWFAGLNIIVVEDGQTPVATGWAVPVRWAGTLPDLPAGYTDSLRRAVEAHETGQQPETLVICGGIVHPQRTGQGLAAYLLTALCDLAPQAGCQKILAPVRPTLKPAYPLTRSRHSRTGPAPTAHHWTRGCGPTGGSAARSSPPPRAPRP